MFKKPENKRKKRLCKYNAAQMKIDTHSLYITHIYFIQYSHTLLQKKHNTQKIQHKKVQRVYATLSQVYITKFIKQEKNMHIKRLYLKKKYNTHIT